MTRMRLHHLHTDLVRLSPQNTLARNAVTLNNLKRRLQVCADRILEQRQSAIKGLEGRLRSLDPETVVKRGYAVLRDASDGNVISSTAAAASGQLVTASVSDGTIDLTVSGIKVKE